MSDFPGTRTRENHLALYKRNVPWLSALGDVWGHTLKSLPGTPTFAVFVLSLIDVYLSLTFLTLNIVFPRVCDKEKRGDKKREKDRKETEEK